MVFSSDSLLDIGSGYESIGVGATIACAFFAGTSCDDVSKPEYHPSNHLCYDVCPDGWYKTADNIC